MNQDEEEIISEQLDKAQFHSFCEAGAGMSKIVQYTKMQIPFASISAEKHHLSAAQNKQRSARLISTLVSAGLGGIQVKGWYQEEGDNQPQSERSFIVRMANQMTEEDFKKILISLMRQYDQEACLYSTGNEVGYLYQNGRFLKKFSRASFDPFKIKDAWTEIRGRKFTYLESGYYASSLLDSVMRKTLGIFSDVPMSAKFVILFCLALFGTPAFADDIPTVTVKVDPPHRKIIDIPVGVVGMRVNEGTGVILEILPGSDLINNHVTLGDRVLAIDNHAFSRETYKAACRGYPGTTCEMTILSPVYGVHQVTIKRRDAKVFAWYNKDPYFAQCAARKLTYTIGDPQ